MLERNTLRTLSPVQKWTRIAILAIGITTLLCYLALSPVLRAFTNRDRASSTPRTGIGIVEQILPPHIEENAKPEPAQVWVRVDGTLAAAETVFGSSQMRVGGPAQVTYRVGKSGRVYVDRVEPLSEPRSNPHP
jgi:hypothetical protein